MTMLRKFAGLFRNLNMTMPPEPVAPEAPLPVIDTVEFFGRQMPRHVPAAAIGVREDAFKHFGPDELVMAHRPMIEQIMGCFSADHLIPGFHGFMLDALIGFAAYTSALPGSRHNHHWQAGGLFAHSLDVGHKALVASASFNVTHGSHSMDREANTLAWQLVVFLCGLLHDVGKVHSMGRVFARTVVLRDEAGRERHDYRPTQPVVWRPSVCSLHEWVSRFDVDSFAIEFYPPGKHKTQHHALWVDRYFHQLVPQPLRAFIYDSDPQIVRLLDEFMQEPLGAAQSALNKAVKDADAISALESLSPGESPSKVHLSNVAVRRIKEFAEDQLWNFPNSTFIRAHIVLDDEADRTVAAQMNFFVATEDNIAHFMSFLDQKDKGSVPLWSTGRESNIVSSVLGALENAGIFLREIPSILPEQRPAPGQDKANPASLAHVLYSPSDPSGVNKDMKFKPIEMVMPLIPLGSFITARTRAFMPTISFWGKPKRLFAESTPIRVENGTLLPENTAQDSDPLAAEAIHAVEETTKKRTRRVTSPAQLELLDRAVSMGSGHSLFRPAAFEPAPVASIDLPPAARPSSSDVAPSESSPDPVELDAMIPAEVGHLGAIKPRSPGQDERARSVTPEAPAVESKAPQALSADLWVKAWSASGTDASCLLSAMFLHALAHGQASAVDGEYRLEKAYESKASRDLFKGDLKARGLDANRIKLWGNDRGIDRTALGQVATIDEEAGQFILRGSAAVLVRDILGGAT